MIPSLSTRATIASFSATEARPAGPYPGECDRPYLHELRVSRTLPLQAEHQQVIRLRGSDVRESAARRRPDAAEAGKIAQVVSRIRRSIVRALERVVHIPAKDELRPFVDR